jgi:hypothetical protein
MVGTADKVWLQLERSRHGADRAMIHGICSGVVPGAPSPHDNHVCVRGCAPTGGLE